MKQQQESSTETAAAPGRLAAQPSFGLALFIILVIALSYYFDGQPTRGEKTAGSAVQAETQR